MQENYNRAVSDIYGSIVGTPIAASNAVGKAAGTVASGFGLFKAGQAINRLRKRKASVVSKPVSRKSKFIRSRGGSNSRSAIRRKAGLKFHERVDRSTGEIKPRWNRAEALRKAGESTKYGLRRFGGRRFRFR